MKKNSFLFQCESSPELKSFVAEKKVNMFLIKFVKHLFLRNSFLRFERLSTNVLHFILSKVQSRRDYFVGKIFVRVASRLSSSEPEHKSSLSELVLKSRFDFLKLHFFFKKMLYKIYCSKYFMKKTWLKANYIKYLLKKVVEFLLFKVD